ncbi:alginate O-acetyltransferase complex protein AlgI [Deinococcus metalli]|uniref:Alginate O-acetylase AlgI n=1 Tax=Deinococcus metalli TaxID=1141878 RepID=A0A7W8NMC4_9DEIO|nr:MBOAT family protein [Deinococcus metalli]MBB5375649.1 alginate O-acetyltransferase complex protein AlgI [Deinococcus metalli]GHF38088.1 putative alginate O-acetylase AlgI [Deinococcus metalli]
MVFSSYIFLFAFLPAFLLAYGLTPARWRSWTILAGSLLFYGWTQPAFLLLLVTVIVVTYVLGGRVLATQGRARWAWLTAGVVVNLGLLGYFKYANMTVSSMNGVRDLFGLDPLTWTHVVLPMGLSFYIFHAISYLVDLHRGTARAPKNIVDFGAFVSLFPHLVAGPILKFHLLADQFRERTHTPEQFALGAQRFMMGLSKKVLLADPLAPLVNAAYSAPHPGAADAWLGSVAYTVQLFFDFSGYSDMAIGLALMLGFKFPENFLDPYTATSITAFWQRWHVSLGTFLREYVYIPLGGNRHGLTRTNLNLFLTMAVGGLWHGANWTFVLWGMWNGGFLVLERVLKKKFGRPPPPVWYAVPKVMLIIILGRVLFRSDSVAHAGEVYRALAGFNGLNFTPDVAFTVTPERLAVLAAGIAVVYVSPLWRSRSAQLRPALVRTAQYALTPVFLLAVATLAAQHYAPFLYFQF